MGKPRELLWAAYALVGVDGNDEDYDELLCSISMSESVLLLLVRSASLNRFVFSVSLDLFQRLELI